MNSLKQLTGLYQSYLEKNPFDGNPPGLYEPMNYIMALGGKRIRPLLTLIGCEACGGQASDALPIAHAVEVFHNFTLVHDDIMDNASTRRGKPTVHEKWSLAEAILAGDNMLIAVYDILSRYSGKDQQSILKLMNKTAREVCEGQQMDMDFASKDVVTEEEYLEMIKLKTAVLLGCSLKAGALTAEADDRVQALLYDFAINLGMSFQLMDDWLDAFGDENKTGKKSGGDIIEGKKTWLYIKASEYENISSLWLKHSGDNRVEVTLDIWKKMELDKQLLALAEEYLAASVNDLKNLSDLGIDVSGLQDLLNFLQQRQH